MVAKAKPQLILILIQLQKAILYQTHIQRSSFYVIRKRYFDILYRFGKMQQAGELLRDQLWDKLKVVFNKFSNNKDHIQTSKVQNFVRDVLGQTSRSYIDYVVKNMFRLDMDENQEVSFKQLANFLFKRHCGQMSLQKMHMQKQIARWSEHLINLKEFITLLNSAFKFLNVTVDAKVAEAVFKDADKDGDGHITYAQYFAYIQKYVCKYNPPAPKPQREWNSKIRIFLWGQLRKLYELFITKVDWIKSLSQNDVLKNLVISILGQLNPQEEQQLLNQLFKIQRGLQFTSFAKKFFVALAQLHLNRLVTCSPQGKRKLNFDQFFTLFRNTYSCLKAKLIRRQILQKVFKKIDTNKNGLITFTRYIQWIKSYIAVTVNVGEEFYVPEDDDSKDGSITQDTIIVPDHKPNHKCPFHFSNKELSNIVRKRVKELLIKYDKNCDQKLVQEEIRQALREILKQNQHQLQYVVKNVFRYDRNSDKEVTYDEFTDFSVEQHFGEMAIQRLHRNNSYSRGKQRIMNQGEFAITINYALGFIGMKADQQQIETLFKQIDLEKKGWISYQRYFLFLRFYFGSLRDQPDDIIDDKQDQQWNKILEKLGVFQRFVRIIIDQLRKLFQAFDVNKNQSFEQDQIQQILIHVFGLNKTQTRYVINQYLKRFFKKGKSLSFDQLIRVLLGVYFVQIILKRRFSDGNSDKWKAKRISLQQFVELIQYACSFLKRKPSKQDLTQIFKALDTDKDGYITFAEYISFIRKYLGVQEQKEEDKTDDTPEQKDIITDIRNQLKAYFDKYDSGCKGYLTKQDLRRFIVEVLNEKSQSQQDYVLWNELRIDTNEDTKYQFAQFATFIISHSGELALQRFHRYQPKGKSTLTDKELFKVLSSAFCFLSSVPKSKLSSMFIYKVIGQGKEPTYGGYLSWMGKVARRFKK